MNKATGTIDLSEPGWEIEGQDKTIDLSDPNITIEDSGVAGSTPPLGAETQNPWGVYGQIAKSAAPLVAYTAGAIAAPALMGRLAAGRALPPLLNWLSAGVGGATASTATKKALGAKTVPLGDVAMETLAPGVIGGGGRLAGKLAGFNPEALANVKQLVAKSVAEGVSLTGLDAVIKKMSGNSFGVADVLVDMGLGTGGGMLANTAGALTRAPGIERPAIAASQRLGLNVPSIMLEGGENPTFRHNILQITGMDPAEIRRTQVAIGEGMRTDFPPLSSPAAKGLGRDMGRTLSQVETAARTPTALRPGTAAQTAVENAMPNPVADLTPVQMRAREMAIQTADARAQQLAKALNLDVPVSEHYGGPAINRLISSRQAAGRQYEGAANAMADATQGQNFDTSNLRQVAERIGNMLEAPPTAGVTPNPAVRSEVSNLLHDMDRAAEMNQMGSSWLVEKLKKLREAQRNLSYGDEQAAWQIGQMVKAAEDSLVEGVQILGGDTAPDLIKKFKDVSRKYRNIYHTTRAFQKASGDGFYPDPQRLNKELGRSANFTADFAPNAYRHGVEFAAEPGAQLAVSLIGPDAEANLFQALKKGSPAAGQAIAQTGAEDQILRRAVREAASYETATKAPGVLPASTESLDINRWSKWIAENPKFIEALSPEGQAKIFALRDHLTAVGTVDLSQIQRAAKLFANDPSMQAMADAALQEPKLSADTLKLGIGGDPARQRLFERNLITQQIPQGDGVYMGDIKNLARNQTYPTPGETPSISMKAQVMTPEGAAKLTDYGTIAEAFESTFDALPPEVADSFRRTVRQHFSGMGATQANLNTITGMKQGPERFVLGTGFWTAINLLPGIFTKIASREWSPQARQAIDNLIRSILQSNVIPENVRRKVEPTNAKKR